MKKTAKIVSLLLTIIILGGVVMQTPFASAENGKIRIAVLFDNVLAGSEGAADTDVEALCKLYTDAGYDVKKLNVKEFADESVLSADAFDVVVLPYGDAFPLSGITSFKKFVAKGGKVITLGGYAFSNVLDTEGEINQESFGLLLESPDVSDSHYTLTLNKGKLEANRTYTISVDMKFDGLATNGRDYGIAYTSVYLYGPSGLDSFKDFAFAENGVSADWITYSYKFTTPASFTKADINLGFYRMSGKAGYDNLRVVDSEGNEVICYTFDDQTIPSGFIKTAVGAFSASFIEGVKNTGDIDVILGTDTPDWVGDYALYAPSNIPLFDPEHVYSDAAAFPAANQDVFSASSAIEGKIGGYSAITVIGENKLRWDPLMYAHDASGEVVGTVGAIAHIFPETKKKGGWNAVWDDYEATSIAFFGVNTTDIVKKGNDEFRKGMVKLVDVLVNDVYTGYALNKYDCYKETEIPTLTAHVCNSTAEDTTGKAVLEIINEETGKTVFTIEKDFKTSAKKSSSVILKWDDPTFDTDFYRERVTLKDKDGNVIDVYETAFAVWKDEVVKNGVNYTYHDNYIFAVNDDGTETPVIASGVDCSSNLYILYDQTPLVTYYEMMERMDAGINICEYLGALHNDISSESYMRKVDLAVYLAQKFNQIFMQGISIGANTAITDSEMKNYVKTCKKLAERYKDVPGFIYYPNGDLVCELSDRMNPAFKEFINSKYKTDEELQKSWNDSSVTLDTVKLELDYSGDDKWTNLKIFDYNVFRSTLVEKWINTLAETIREVDTSGKLVICEFYSYPFSGIDIPTALGTTDYSNIGFFEDASIFPQTLSYSDQRYIGKAMGIGEYGRRTNTLMNAASYTFHRAVTQEEATRHVFTVYNNAVTMGANHIHLWCWADSTEYIFPWGTQFALDGARRPLYYNIRNASLFARTFEPVYTSPEVAYLTADRTRFSSNTYIGHHDVVRGLDILERTNIAKYITINDSNLIIPDSVKVIFYPISYDPSDEVIEKLTEFVKKGGVLYLSGDISYDEYRDHTKTDRLEALAGVKCEKVLFDGYNFKKSDDLTYTNGEIIRSGSPNITISLAGAEAVYYDNKNNPIITKYKLGDGIVVFSSDPIELYTSAKTSVKDAAVYTYVMSLAGVEPYAIETERDNGAFKLSELTLADGSSAYSIFNCDSENAKNMKVNVKGLDVEMNVPASTTYIFRVSEDGLFGVQNTGSVKVNGKEAVFNGAFAEVYTLDGKTIDKSKQIIATPLAEGQMKIANDAIKGDITILSGDTVNGIFVTQNSIIPKIEDGYIVFDVAEEDVNKILLISDGDAILDSVSALVTGFTCHSLNELAKNESEEKDVSETSENVEINEKSSLLPYFIIGGVLVVGALAALVIIKKKKK